jgi:hypothetical protein
VSAVAAVQRTADVVPAPCGVGCSRDTADAGITSSGAVDASTVVRLSLLRMHGVGCVSAYLIFFFFFSNSSCLICVEEKRDGSFVWHSFDAAQIPLC